MTRLERLRQRLNLYLDAEQKILAAQRYRISDRELQRADLSTVQKMIDDLEAEIALLENPKGSTRRVVFVE